MLQQSIAASLFPVCQLIVNYFIYSENLTRPNFQPQNKVLSLIFFSLSKCWLVASPIESISKNPLVSTQHDMYFHLCAFSSSIHSRKKWPSSNFSLTELTNYLFFSFKYNNFWMSFLVSTLILNSSFPCILIENRLGN